MGAAEQSPASLDRAREIVIAHGWNSTAYQVLNPGIEHWFSPTYAALVGFTRRGKVLLVAGGPICEPHALPGICDRFEFFARQRGFRVCYVCAEERLRALFENDAAHHSTHHATQHATIALGAQPVWNPAAWPEIVGCRSSLRAQLHRARNKGVTVEAVSTEHAADDPELRRILRQWIKGRSLPPLHFLTEPNVLDGLLKDRIILLARRHSAAVAFLVASPARAGKGYLVELLARSAAAPNGSSEVLIDAAMRRFASEGCEYATLGLVALAHAADPEIQNNPAWLRLLMYFARAHANRFYNFRGLERFRVKMAPERWETVYAISNEPRFSPQTLYAIGGAFSGIPPWAAIAIGVAKAAGAELQALRARIAPGAIC